MTKTHEEQADEFVEMFKENYTLGKEYNPKRVVATPNKIQSAIKHVEGLIKEVDSMRSSFSLNRRNRIDYLTSVKAVLEQRINKQKR